MAQYFIYRIAAGPSSLVKRLEKIDRFDAYRDAKSLVKKLRQEQALGDTATYKIIFAESALDAEEKLSEKRDSPIIEEWEK